jgi:glycosyltransferase involved in cell wall biosynthesis
MINARYGLAILRGFRALRPIPLSWTYSLEQDSPVFASDIRGGGFHAILAYERFPSRTFDLPVAWITGPTHLWRKREEGAPAAEAERMVEWKRARAEQAKRLIFTTQSARDLFVQQSGEHLRGKSRVIPFFLPELGAADDISEKWESPDLRFVFVGRQALRKGLPQTVEAMTPLLEANPKLSLTIISSQDGGQVAIPSLPNIIVRQEATREEVLALLQQSHVLLMPSAWESYGFVYIEAMSRGCVPLAVDRPVQRELLGAHGLLVGSQDSEEIGAVIRDAMGNVGRLKRMAEKGLEEFRVRFSPEAVAGEFRRVIGELLGGG